MQHPLFLYLLFLRQIKISQSSLKEFLTPSLNVGTSFPFPTSFCIIKDLFDDTEKEGQEALKQFQAKFNIVPEEPTIENPVIEDNSVSPELEDEINQILAIANNVKE